MKNMDYTSNKRRKISILRIRQALLSVAMLSVALFFTSTADAQKVAVKTNLLFDAALTPNIEVERWFGKHNHWSAMAEVWFPWYTAHHNSRAYQVLNIGAELRYWMFPHNGNLRPLHGQFLGLYAAGGKYDIEWGSNGDQGEFTSIGLTYGYAFRLAKHFNMELSVSGGYLGGPYRHYHGLFNDSHLVWQRSEHRNYIGPTKAKVSLVWLW